MKKIVLAISLVALMAATNAGAQEQRQQQEPEQEQRQESSASVGLGLVTIADSVKGVQLSPISDIAETATGL